MKYNIGDKVRIRKDLIVNEYYGKIDFIEAMKKYLGKETIICAIDYENGKEFGYLLKDCDLYTWTDEMLEPIEVTKITFTCYGRYNEIIESKRTFEYNEEKTPLEKALELLNMTEEEMNKEYNKKKDIELGVEITNEFNHYCCNRCDCNGCIYKEYENANCKVMFVLNYLKEKGMLKDEL